MLRVILVLALCLLAPAAATHPIGKCGTSEQLKQLLDLSKESPAWMGISNERNRLVILWQNADGLWTISVLDPRGTTCIIEHGHSGGHVVQGTPARG